MSTDDEQLKIFLQTIHMECIFDYLKSSQVTFRSLPYLKQEDMQEAVPPLGLRVEFREKLFAWKKDQLGVEEMDGVFKVEEWLTESKIRATSPSTSYDSSRRGRRILYKDLKNLLNETSRGKAVLEYSNENHDLTCQHRDDFISILVEEVMANSIVLSPRDFSRLMKEICALFPFEESMQDYYYIPRKGKNNASGKLYAKYRNKLLKKRKSLGTIQSARSVFGT